MCQIMALKTTVKKFKKILNSPWIIQNLDKSLQEKGGDYYSAALISGKVSVKTKGHSQFSEVLYSLQNSIKYQKLKGTLNILFFSRQRPEMEEGVVEDQPYTHENLSENGLTFIFAVHGTIHNDKELAQELGVTIGADTEIMKYLNPQEFYKAEGAYALIGIDDSNILIQAEHGLDIWSNHLISSKGKHLADVIATLPLTWMNPTIIDYTQLEKYSFKRKEKTLMVAFSGGMDISLSVFKSLSSDNYTKVILNYFAWGSRAEQQEILHVEKLKDFYSSNFKRIDFQLNIIQASGYFNEYFNINGALPPKISVYNQDSEGDVGETESPLAYVPYRNTQFAILLASLAEAKGLKNVDILFGLNLSEGMVFMDNSQGWLESITKTVQFGGKDFKYTGTYKVIAPYFPRTKTNIIQEFNDEFGFTVLEQLLNLSTSCYYPGPDGSPCGACGSCILREKAISKIKDKK